MLVLDEYLELEAHISQQASSGSKYWKFNFLVNSIAANLPILAPPQWNPQCPCATDYMLMVLDKVCEL